MTTLRTAPRRGAKTAASIAALILLPLSLTACGGGDSSASSNDHGDPVSHTGASLDGEYYSDKSQLLIENNAVSLHTFNGCSLSDDASAQGNLSDDNTQIIWRNEPSRMKIDGENIEEDAPSMVSTTTVNKNKVITVEGVAFQEGTLDDALDTYNADFGGCD